MKKIIIILIILLVVIKDKSISEKIINNKITYYDDMKTYESLIDKYQSDYNNKDIIGELSIPGTDLKVPIVRGRNNYYYLNHNLNKKEDKLGSIFLDYRNNPTDKKILIYGHNSKTLKTKFKILENYLDETYLKEHSKIILKTAKNLYQYQVFSVMIVDSEFQHLLLDLSKDDYKKHLEYLKSNSLYDTEVITGETDEIIILQTCFYTPPKSYLLVIGKKVN